MPFAQHNGVVALGPHDLAEHYLRGRHRQVVDRVRDVLLAFTVIVAGQRAGEFVGTDQFGERLRRGRELEAEAGGVAAGHDGGARRRAGGVAGIGLGEGGAVLSDRIDARRRHKSAGNAAAIEGDIVPAEIVGEDHHHIRRTNALRRRGRPVLPGDLTVWADGILDRRDDSRQVVPVAFEGGPAGNAENHYNDKRNARERHSRHQIFLRSSHVAPIVTSV